MSLNVRGCQEKGLFRKLCRAAKRWARDEGIHVLCVQEHNLHPSRVRELEISARDMGWGIAIGLSHRVSHRGGTLVMWREAEHMR